MTSCTGSVGGGFWGIWEKSVSWVSCLGRRRLTFACGRYRTWCVADGNIVIERLCRSLPHVEKPFNSKVIKSFVPELRSRKCFLCFGIPMLSICALWTLWTFCVPVWICLFQISMYSYVTLSLQDSQPGKNGNESVLLTPQKFINEVS